MVEKINGFGETVTRKPKVKNVRCLFCHLLHNAEGTDVVRLQPFRAYITQDPSQGTPH